MTFDAINQFQTAPGEPAFERWRPKQHLMAPRGWLNDPCAPCYDPVTKLYHIFYQWNPKGTDWGNMSWGHSTSTDLIHWTNVPPKGCDDSVPALAPDMAYDKDGVFTGCWCPVDVGDAVEELKGKAGLLGVYYTSVQSQIYLEDGSYQRGSESLSFAYSQDEGKTWKKHERNPFIAAPPDGLSVTGWRDPYAAPHPRLDSLLGRAEPHIYAIIAGGIADVGPAFFLYSFPIDKPLEWEYLGTPIEPTAKLPTSVWAGLPGFNWEVGNFFTLGDGDDSSDYLITGAQFKEKDIAKLPSVMKPRIKPECPGLPIWMSGKWMVQDGKVWYQRNATGMLDYGWYYACNSFEDPTSGRRILWGWILENDLSSMRRARNGWSGCMAIPRELTQLVIRNVVSTVSPGVALGDLDSCVVSATSTKANTQVHTIQTMGMQPVMESRNLYGEPRVHLEHVVATSGKTIPFGNVGKHWQMEMEVELQEPASCQLVVSLRHSPDFEEVTDVVVGLATASINVVRDRSTSDKTEIFTGTEYGSFTLFNVLQEDESVRPETFNLRIICDNSVVEVFANERFALSTRAYPTRQDAVGLSLKLLAENGKSVEALIRSCDVRIAHR